MQLNLFYWLKTSLKLIVKTGWFIVSWQNLWKIVKKLMAIAGKI